MIEVFFAPFSRESREETKSRLTARISTQTATIAYFENRKPYLQTSDHVKLGIGITHVRRTAVPFGLMAVSPVSAIGIDAEYWPEGQGGTIFQQSIASREDAAMIRHLRGKPLDSGTLLWVAKEAALKSTGEVMNDPRHVAITKLKGNMVRAESSVLATAPITPSILAFYTMRAPKSGERILLAVASPYLDKASLGFKLQPEPGLDKVEPLDLDSL